ncbi:MAG: NAD(P)H-hydrate dehydratase, partial [Muribaculaceae bacterium]|nr:NAD(P)H-hydrate dehydratase [Muribaculaceae bacterium]
RMLTPRKPDCSKADFGSAVIYAGSYGMMGAAVLAGKGALRSGAGKVTMYAPRCGFNILQTAIPEAMFRSDTNDLVISEIAPGGKYTSVAIGPGIGTNDRTIRALDGFLAAANKPVILDADALNCIAASPSMLNSIPVLSIITPHAGEFDRLFGAQSCMDARLRKAIEVAMHYKFFIILKGRYTAVVRPDGKIYFNSSGTPAMATPGAGDVLTGVLSGFMAQPFSPEYSSILAVYVHGVAGELAAEEHGTYGVTAGDIADKIGCAIQQIMTKPSR